MSDERKEHAISGDDLQNDASNGENLELEMEQLIAFGKNATTRKEQDELNQKLMDFQVGLKQHLSKEQEKDNLFFGLYSDDYSLAEFWHATAWQCMNKVYYYIDDMRKEFNAFVDEAKQNVEGEFKPQLDSEKRVLNKLQWVLLAPESPFKHVTQEDYDKRQYMSLCPQFTMRFPLNKEMEQEGWENCEKCSFCYRNNKDECPYCHVTDEAE